MMDPKHELSITRQAELLEISRASVYYVPRPLPEADLALMRRMDELPVPQRRKSRRVMFERASKYFEILSRKRDSAARLFHFP